MDLGLTGKVAVVTGATKGLGFATATILAQEGAKVVICGRTNVDNHVARLREVTGRSDSIAGTTADVSNDEDILALIQFAVDTFGGLDILVTNAGGPPGGTFEALSQEQWDFAAELTLMSPVKLIRAALPYLKASAAASVLTITSISAKQPVAGLMLSNVMRPAVLGMTKTLSQELAPSIRFNSILPGWTATERVEQIFAYRAEQNGTDPATESSKITDNIPLGRFADPLEFGRVAAFMVSPAASYITGTMVPVDGGNTLGLL